MDELDVKAPEFSNIIWDSPGIHLVDKKRAFSDGSDKKHDSKENSGMEGVRGTRLWVCDSYKYQSEPRGWLFYDIEAIRPN